MSENPGHDKKSRREVPDMIRNGEVRVWRLSYQSPENVHQRNDQLLKRSDDVLNNN
jgi:hypothetical protein